MPEFHKFQSQEDIKLSFRAEAQSVYGDDLPKVLTARNISSTLVASIKLKRTFGIHASFFPLAFGGPNEVQVSLGRWGKTLGRGGNLGGREGRGGMRGSIPHSASCCFRGLHSVCPS